MNRQDKIDILKGIADGTKSTIDLFQNEILPMDAITGLITFARKHYTKNEIFILFGFMPATFLELTF